MQRPHVRRCAGGGRAQTTQRSDGSAIEPDNAIHTSNQEVGEITSSDLVALVVIVEEDGDLGPSIIGVLAGYKARVK